MGRLAIDFLKLKFKLWEMRRLGGAAKITAMGVWAREVDEGAAVGRLFLGAWGRVAWYNPRSFQTDSDRTHAARTFSDRWRI